MFSNVELDVLREIHSSEIFKIVQKEREYLRQWLVWVDDTKSEEDTKEFIQKVSEKFQRGEEYPCVIFYKDRLVGLITLMMKNKPNSSKQGELGYWISQDFAGKGIMSVAVKNLIEKGFKRFQLVKIVIRCAVSNQKSCAIPKRFGFKLDGTLRNDLNVNGVLHDAHIYSLLRDEWFSSQVEKPTQIQEKKQTFWERWW